MPETEWNSTTAPEEGAIVYVLAADNRGNTRFHSPSSFETIAVERSHGEELDAFVAGWRPVAMSTDDARRCIWLARLSQLSRPE